MNHLSTEKSPYLLQHADNPVDWHPWGQEAFDKALREQKPVFLSIGYSTCHWCHVMAHESFENDDIARLLNSHFISIKVDREERPDIDHIYMTAVTAMTGQGGWPLSVFLTPEARPFFGGTYFPPYAKWGAMGFKDLLVSLAGAWKEKRGEIDVSAAEIAGILQARTQPVAEKIPLQEAEASEMCAQARRQLAAHFDPQYGGFGEAPKFPMGHNLSFLLCDHARTKEAESLSIVEKTLASMARSGTYDHLGGGFHRYATDRQWQVPHFEKMLYDQALLVLAYAQAYQETGNALYCRTVRETLDYVLRDMTSAEGGFYCAEDADSEGYEGRFYIWSAKEIQEVLGPDAALFNRTYGIGPGGNVRSDPHGEFVGQNILGLAQDVAPQDEGPLAQARQKLFARRIQRIRPHLDDKVLTDWNGLMVAAMSFAGCVLNEPRYIQAAAAAADFILEHLAKNGRLLHRWRKGEAAIDGMLEDYAFFLYGLEQLYEATFEERYLQKAQELARQMAEHFEDKERGGFFMTAGDAPGLIARPQDIYDGALPSGNSVAAYALVKLHYLTGQEVFMAQAREAFGRFAAAVSQMPSGYCFFLVALDFGLFAPVEVTLRAPAGDEATIAKIRKVVYKHFVPGLVFKYVPADGPWAASVCRGAVCLPPVNDLAALEKTLNG